MANTNIYPDGYVVIPRKDYDELIMKINAKPEKIHTKPKRTDKPDTEENLPAKKKKGIDGEKILALYDAGWKPTDIAKEIGCAQQTVYNHLKERRQ